MSGILTARHPPPADARNWQTTASGLAVPASYSPPRLPTGVDLFCGCGGFSLGMMHGGFQIVAACDHDPAAAITYMVNLGAYPIDLVCLSDDDEKRLEAALQQHFGLTKDGKRGILPAADVSGSNNVFGPGVPNFFFGDIRKLTGDMILQATGLKRGEIDCVCGGPPCQGFSMAGKRNVMDPRNSLVFEFARLVIELMPKTIVMENVPGIASMVTPDGEPVVDALCRILEDGGWGTLDAVKRTLLANAGTGAALRSVKGSSDKSEEDDEDGETVQADQMALFAE